MAAIDLIGHAERADAARVRKSLHPSCYLLMGLGILIFAAIALDTMVGVLL